MKTMNSGSNWLLAVVILIAAAPMAYAQATWTDPQTQLMWAKESNSADVNWNQAKDYCANLTIGGYSDWRLPTIDELAGIYDGTQNVDGLYVKGSIRLHGGCFAWSSSAGSASREAGMFSFTGGQQRYSFPLDRSNYYLGERALCVRRSGGAEYAQPSNADIASSQPAETGVAKTAAAPMAHAQETDPATGAVATAQAPTAKDYQLPDGTKVFGERTLKDGSKKVERVEFLNGQKNFDVTVLPDGSKKVGRIEFPDGSKIFDMTMLPNGTQKQGRVEYANGQERFAVTILPDGTEPQVTDKDYFIERDRAIYAKNQAIFAKDQADINSRKIAGEKKIRELGLHNGQSQAQVKSILIARGFEPWDCDTVGYTVQCVAKLPSQGNVDLVFNNVMRRDPDSGTADYTGQRVLGMAVYFPK